MSTEVTSRIHAVT